MEVAAFLFIWLISLQHSLFRPANRAWLEQLSLAALACLFLPLLDVIQQPQRLVRAVEQQNYVYIGFELSLVLTGLLLFKTVKALLRKQKRQGENPLPGAGRKLKPGIKLNDVGNKPNAV